MDSIFKNGIAPTQDVNGGHEGTRGGFDLPDGKKETPGTTIGTLPTLTNVKDAPGAGSAGDLLGLIGSHKAGSEF